MSKCSLGKLFLQTSKFNALLPYTDSFLDPIKPNILKILIRREGKHGITIAFIHVRWSKNLGYNQFGYLPHGQHLI